MLTMVATPAPSPVLRAPFVGETWRRSAYALVALSVGLLSVPLVLAGGPAGRLQARVARLLPGVAVGDASRRRVLLHGLLGVPLNAAAFAITGYGLLVVVLNLGYPLRPLLGLSADPADSWGGPTLAGTWAVHAAAGLVALFLMPWIVRGLTGLQARLLRAVLGR
jgi:hypothetical protein